MSHVRRVIDSFFGGTIPARLTLPARVPVIALIAEEENRAVLKSVPAEERLDIHLASSGTEANALAQRLKAPVILLDRDWPGSEWKTMVESLSKSPHGPCLILVSSVSDDTLWEELIRRGGYEILKKPLQVDKVARMTKLALSYWTSATRQAVTARRLRNEGRNTFRKSILS